MRVRKDLEKFKKHLVRKLKPTSDPGVATSWHWAEVATQNMIENLTGLDLVYILVSCFVFLGRGS